MCLGSIQAFNDMLNSSGEDLFQSFTGLVSDTASNITSQCLAAPQEKVFHEFMTPKLWLTSYESYFMKWEPHAKVRQSFEYVPGFYQVVSQADLSKALGNDLDLTNATQAGK